MRFWISWYTASTGPAAQGAFEIYSPWWVSGETMHDPPRYTIVCAIVAEDEEDAKQKVINRHDEPEAAAPDIEWRFCEEREEDWEPFCGRFPRGDWMLWPSDGGPPKDP